MSDTAAPEVFLGGSCNPTTWRADVAMPALDEAGVTYYNPQVDDWHDGLVALEAAAKEESEILLFVIDGQTRALVSVLEATEYICTGRDVVLVIIDVEDGTDINGQVITGRELKDVNRVRAYLRDTAERHGTPVLDSIEDAVAYIISNN